MPECCACACHSELTRLREELLRCQSELQLRAQQLDACLRQRTWGQIGEAGVDSSGPAAPMDPILTDYLPARDGSTSGPWLEAHFQDLADVSDSMQLGTNLWQFAPMRPGETLQEHVRRQVQGGSCPGPHSETSLVFKSRIAMAARRFANMQEAARVSAHCWSTVATFRSEWQAMLKNLLAGNFDPIVTRTVLFGDAAKGTESRGFKFITWPAVIVDDEGQRHWGMVQQVFPASQAFLNTWRLRDLLTVKHTPSCITIVAAEGGAIVWQNAASMATFGVHGRFNTSAKHGEGPAAAPTEHDDALVFGSQYNFMYLIFESNKGELDVMKAAVQGGDTFRTQVEVVHPTLRSLMGLGEGEEAHHDVQMSLTRDPVTLQQVYTVAQIDVTAAVLAKRQVQLAHAQLEEEKVRTEVLLHRQYELVECLGWVSDVGRSAAGNKQAAELIDSVRRQIVDDGVDGGGEKIELLQLLGEGSFGKVYKGLWRGKAVAVKSMVLPRMMNGSEKKERMAIVEAAISSSLSHPNIVQTYTYSLKPVRETTPTRSAATSGTLPTEATIPHPSNSAAGSARSLVSAFEVQIVLELCDRGNLRDALMLGGFSMPGRSCVNYSAVLEVAADVARGMQHLHACNILHSDLKAANVLLQSNANEAKGVTAKIADFGLSVQLSSAETHVSGLYQGTVTHMAPETLLSGQQSNAADVYAFGITMWELYTGERPYANVPRAHLGYKVTRENKRPVFPDGIPPDYEALAELCWHELPTARPSFAEILEVLEALREARGGATPRLQCCALRLPAGAAPPAPGALWLHSLEPPSHVQVIGASDCASCTYGSGAGPFRPGASWYTRDVATAATPENCSLLVAYPLDSLSDEARAAPQPPPPAAAVHPPPGDGAEGSGEPGPGPALGRREHQEHQEPLGQEQQLALPRRTEEQEAPAAAAHPPPGDEAGAEPGKGLGGTEHQEHRVSLGQEQQLALARRTDEQEAPAAAIAPASLPEDCDNTLLAKSCMVLESVSY